MILTDQAKIIQKLPKWRDFGWRAISKQDQFFQQTYCGGNLVQTLAGLGLVSCITSLAVGGFQYHYYDEYLALAIP